MHPYTPYRSRPRDVIFQDFITEHSLKVCSTQKDTFFHNNGKYTSQIDYFLVDQELNEVVKKPRTEDLHGLNTPDHTLIPIRLQLKMKKTNKLPNRKKVLSKTKWEQCNRKTYQSEVKANVDQMKSGNTSSCS
ncbi:hypothetical protein DPMN_114809 [Dreissena polymorpha]|uniref:Uncharacterized protein n=1 Tax=Dreissena polymorpha TaxID=45954 RepID=A0A9D4QT75_DREPO|nr:hypothetical protein DPMN_114809 [Dreissena polymorpha]